VEHLLRDIKDIGDLGTLSHRIQYQLASLKVGVWKEMKSLLLFVWFVVVVVVVVVA